MEKIQFKRIIQDLGTSQGITLPPEILKYLEANKSDTLIIQPENSKHGKHISIWKQNKEVYDEKKE